MSFFDSIPSLLTWMTPVAVIVMAIPARGLLRGALVGRRWSITQCQRCGFERSAAGTRPCPECGAESSESTRRIRPSARLLAVVLALTMLAPALVRVPALTYWILNRQVFEQRLPDTRLRLQAWLGAPSLRTAILSQQSIATLRPSTLRALTRWAATSVPMPAPFPPSPPAYSIVPESPKDLPSAQPRSSVLLDQLATAFRDKALDESRRGAILDGYLAAASRSTSADEGALAAALAEVCWGKPVVINSTTRAVGGNKATPALTQAQIDAITRFVLQRQADPTKAWTRLWGAAFEGLASRNLVAEPMVAQYRQNAARVGLQVRSARPVVGQPSAALVTLELRTGGNVDLAVNFTPDQACADVVHLAKDWAWKSFQPDPAEQVLVLKPTKSGKQTLSGTVSILPTSNRGNIAPRLANPLETTTQFWSNQPPTTITRHVSVECDVVPASAGTR